MIDAERRLFVISGCSGGGKSTLLKALAKRGHRIVEEPGRRIVHREQEHGGNALPWIHMKAFAQAAISMALNDLERSPAYGLVFFDRGLIDAASALRSVTGDRFLETLKYDHRYASRYSSPRRGQKFTSTTGSGNMDSSRP